MNRFGLIVGSIITALFFVITTDLIGQGCTWNGLQGGLLGPSSSSDASALAVFDDGSGEALYVGGDFNTAGGVAVSNIARWNGASWSPVGAGLASECRALAVFDDGTGPALYALASGVWRWNGAAWSLIGQTAGPTHTIAVADDGSGPALYAGVSTIGGISAGGIARWTGAGWVSVGGGLNPSSGRAWAITSFDDGTGPALYVGGFFTGAGGITSPNIIRWNGSTWSALGAGVSGTGTRIVGGLRAFDDGSGPALYASGSLNNAGGASVTSVARWNGSAWSAVGSRSGSPPALGIYDDGSGPALYRDGSSSNGLYRWTGATWTLAGALSSGAADINALTVWDDGAGPALYITGRFTSAGGVTANNIASYRCGVPISVTLDQPGGPGTGVYLANANLAPGHEYYNLVSVSPCPGGAGTGGTLGLCIDVNLLALYSLQPLRFPGPANPTPLAPFRFRAPGDYVLFGPYPPLLAPATLEAVCFDATLGYISTFSPVATLLVQ